MSIAVPVILFVLLSAQVYGIWPNYESEQKDKTEQTDKSSSEDKSERTDESSSKKMKSSKADKSSKGGESSPAAATKARQPRTKNEE
jgi:cytoskeletal protein RodZ